MAAAPAAMAAPLKKFRREAAESAGESLWLIGVLHRFRCENARPGEFSAYHAE